MDRPNKCKNCQWYGKPYWSIINPCDNCPMENVETFTSFVDPTIGQLKEENERLNNIIDKLDKLIEQYSKNEYYYKYNGKYLKSEIINDLKELKEGVDNESL